MNGSINQNLMFGQNYGACQLVARTGTSGVRIALQFGTSSITFYGVNSTGEIPIGQFTHLVGTWAATSGSASHRRGTTSGSIVWSVAILAIFAPLAVARYRKMAAGG